MYRIRFHGRGGQGMKTAGRILGTSLFLQGYEIQDAPRYGAERRGAPIFAFVRADKAPIFERGIIRRPDLVVVADESLVPMPAAGVLAGVDAHSVLLINSRLDAETWRHRLALEGPVLTLPAPVETGDRSALPHVGTYCAGAAASLLGVIERESLAQAIEQELGHLGETVKKENLQQALQAFDLMREQSGSVTEQPPLQAVDWNAPAWIDLPLEGTDVSAPAIHAGLTSELMPTGLWRTMRPEVDYERCNRCWWICSTFCPDSAIAVDENNYPQIDYDHCKGCLVCVAQCPPHAITAEPEHGEEVSNG